MERKEICLLPQHSKAEWTGPDHSFLRRIKGECYVVITSQYRYLDTTPWITLNVAKCNKTRKGHLQQSLKLNPGLIADNDKIRKNSSWLTGPAKPLWLVPLDHLHASDSCTGRAFPTHSLRPWTLGFSFLMSSGKSNRNLSLGRC